MSPAALLAAAAGLVEADAGLALDLAAALAAEGGAAPAADVPLAHALHAYAAHGDLRPVLSLPPGTRADALLVLADTVAGGQATEIARALERERLVPVSPRLAGLLATADAALCERLLAAAGREFGEGGGIWAEAVVEARLAALDAGEEPPAAVAVGWAALTGGADTAAEVETVVGRLRLEARRDLIAALALLDDAIGAVGLDAVEVGAEAVLGRLAGADPDAARDFVRDGPWRLGERALLFRCTLWETPPAESRSELAALARLLANARDLSPREAWATTHELLAAAARLGEIEAAVGIVDATGPPAWTGWNASWGPLRKHGGAEGYVDRLFTALEATEPGIASAGAPLAPTWSLLAPALQREYARLKSRAPCGTPWWKPWDAGLP